MKVLVWRNKFGIDVFDASTPEIELASYFHLFKTMDGKDFQFYNIPEIEQYIAVMELKLTHKKCSSCGHLEPLTKLTKFVEYETKRQIRISRMMIRLIAEAREGSAESAKKLIQLRTKNEYESVREENVWTPPKAE